MTAENLQTVREYLVKLRTEVTSEAVDSIKNEGWRAAGLLCGAASH